MIGKKDNTDSVRVDPVAEGIWRLLTMMKVEMIYQYGFVNPKNAKSSESFREGSINSKN